MNKFYWMCVEIDEYELPLAVADTAKELAKMLGITENTVLNCVMRGRSGRQNGYKYLKVERGEPNDTDDSI